MRIFQIVVLGVVALLTAALVVATIGLFIAGMIGGGLATLVGAVVAAFMARSLWKQLTAAA